LPKRRIELHSEEAATNLDVGAGSFIAAVARAAIYADDVLANND
jgi:hypothetical protein